MAVVGDFSSAVATGGLRLTQMGSLGRPTCRTISAMKSKVGTLIQPRWRPQQHIIEDLCGPRPAPITASCPPQRGHGSGIVIAKPIRFASEIGRTSWRERGEV